jgi:hypothetical protein
MTIKNIVSLVLPIGTIIILSPFVVPELHEPDYHIEIKEYPPSITVEVGQKWLLRNHDPFIKEEYEILILEKLDGWVKCQMVTDANVIITFSVDSVLESWDKVE